MPFESHICTCILLPFSWKLETCYLVEKCFCKAVICLEMLRCCKCLFIKSLIFFFYFREIFSVLFLSSWLVSVSFGYTCTDFQTKFMFIVLCRTFFVNFFGWAILSCSIVMGLQSILYMHCEQHKLCRWASSAPRANVDIFFFPWLIS